MLATVIESCQEKPAKKPINHSLIIDGQFPWQIPPLSDAAWGAVSHTGQENTLVVAYFGWKANRRGNKNKQLPSIKKRKKGS